MPRKPAPRWYRAISAKHLEQAFAAKPKNWSPLVYCWRGGKRSGSMAHVLGQIGWHSGQLDGGYKAYRHQVLEDLQTLPARFQWRVVCGATGSGKSRLLQALHAAGAQVLDLEDLANHRGSLLGNLPGTPQPAQKYFESLVWSKLHGFDPAQPVYVEAESKKIGNVRVPEALIAAMWQSQCIRVEASIAQRVELLKEEYPHFLADPDELGQKLGFPHRTPRQGTHRPLAANGTTGRMGHAGGGIAGAALRPGLYPLHAQALPALREGLILQPQSLSMEAMQVRQREILKG